MTVTKEILLQSLPVYMGAVDVITDDQSVNDIIRGVKFCHKKYANDYDQIAHFFVGDTERQTCLNIFNFIRRSSFYYIEDETKQTLRSPAAILATGQTIGIDCKNYALFIGGILDAINRSGIQYIPFVYRFASDKLFDTTPNHVFIVAFPGSDSEIWIDPIPQIQYFDQRLTYYYHTDKKFNSMSLEILSGRSSQIGFVDPATAIGIFNVAKGFFTGGGAPNPRDWMGWPSVGDAKWWVLHDGDSVSNEAVNIISWIKAHGMTGFFDGSGGVQAVTVDQIAQKLIRGGFPQEAQQILSAGSFPQQSVVNPSDGSYYQSSIAPSSNTTKYLLLGGAAIAAVLILRKKKVSGKTNPLVYIGAAAVGLYLYNQSQKNTIDVPGAITIQTPQFR